MPAKDKDQMGEYEAAMLLPSNEHTTLLHKFAAEHQRMHSVDFLEGALHTAQLMRQRWEHDLPHAGTEGFRPFVGSREATRCCVLTESLQGKLTALRNRSYRFARAKLFHRHGVRIEFPSWPEESITLPAQAQPEPVEVEITPAPPEPVAQTAPAAPHERLVVKREVKAAMQRLQQGGVKGAELQVFKQRCLAGNVTEAQMREWAQNLLSGVRAA